MTTSTIPDLAPSDVDDLKRARARVLRLMQDGRWHTATEIIDVAGQREGLRRMRELRKVKGFSIRKSRIPGRREWQYQLYAPSVTLLD